ncbi:hypothetical protein KI387_035338 [Taxus chinensis]|uniref:Uncharacterized protein n=1 Tax=Taxus chinensis TaxID=29808 RepID=A0AA38FMJ1_TAXCH|nr:hypothetical protein KI387_035338 [Taxus chinensis]
MGRNGVLYGCFSSKNRAPSSPDKLYDSSSSHSEQLSNRGGGGVPSFKLAPLSRQRAYPHHAVGIDDQVSSVIQLLEWENETNAAVAVVLHGLGGAGKTTVAEAVVATLDIQGWEYSTAVSVTDGNGREQGETQPEEQAFIYMDNFMVVGKHLHELVPKNCKKLRLLVTARDEMVADVISGCGIRTHLYPVRPLPFHDARKLLCNKMGVAGTMQISQINQILKICDGVPLVLERVGAYICQSLDKDEACRRVIEWSEDGKPFSSAQEHSIEENGLLFDLDELPASNKEVFLDICSFFNGWDWDKVSCITGEQELNSLQKRDLLLKKEECENKVTVRPIVLTIGRKTTKGKRFTSPHDLSKVLEGNDLGDIRGIKGIWLQDNVSQPFLISARKLDLMHESLRVLALGDMSIVVDGQCSQKFKQITYFQAGLIPCLPFYPTAPQELRFLDCRVPHTADDLQLIKMSSKLEVLNLDGDRYNRQFEIANVFQRLRGLRTLKLVEFEKLEMLPDELLLLTQLEELDLSGCKILVQLPKGLGNLSTLNKLSLKECSSLQELPDLFGNLRSLKYLDLHACETLKQLPEDFGSLSCLEELDLGYCSSLQELPTSFGKLFSLKVLTLVRCTSLHRLRHDIIYLSALVQIEFQESSVVSIPCRDIKLVKDISSPWSVQLTNLPKRLIEITSLRSLDLHNWSSLERLPEGFGQALQSLAELHIRLCISLQELSDDFHCLASLQTLKLEYCEELQGKWMDSVVKIKTLELVNIAGSPMLNQRWAELAEGGESWSFVVGEWPQEWKWNRMNADTKQKWNNIENVLNNDGSKLLNGEWLLTDSHGEPFSLSTAAPNTLLLLLYHYPHLSTGSFYDWFQWKFLQEIVMHEHPPPFQMIYVGKYFDQLPRGVAEGITAYASLDSDAHLFFKKALNAKFYSSITCPIFVLTRIVTDEEGRKHFSTWEDITYHQCENILFPRSRLFSELQKLTEQPQESNVQLLRALFDSEGSRTGSVFLRNYTENMGVDELHGKTVLLLISDMVEHPFQTLKDIYSKINTNDDIEILSIPIPAEVRRKYKRPPGSDLAGFESILRNVPWPVLRNPWLLKTRVCYFFKREWGDLNQGILVVVDPNGRICHKNALPLVRRWGAEVYPFTDEKMRRLEQNNMPSAEIL